MEAKLQALEAGGVDNWEWYGESLSEYHKYTEMEDLYEETIGEIYEALHDKVGEPAGVGCGYGFMDADSDLKKVLKSFLNQVKDIEDD